MTAVTASTPVAATSVAAHVYHLNFAMEVAAAWICRAWTPRNWAESWGVTAVSDEWALLLREMRRRYDALLVAVSTHALRTEEGIGGAIAAVAHAAYHLGAIRQKLAVLGTT